MAEAEADPEFMLSLARGLAVLRSFSQERQPLTVAEASRATGLSRSATRRCLYTLVRLGYASQDGQIYSLRPKVLELGYSFLASSTLAVRAQPLLDRLRDELGESCSLGVLEDGAVTYIARAEVTRIMAITLRVGSRLPLDCTSMGRVLLAGMTDADREDALASLQLLPRTERTVTDPDRLRTIIARVHRDGYAIVDQELEIGLRSVAVPVLGSTGVIGAVNIGMQAMRVSAELLQERYLPALRRVARDLGGILAQNAATVDTGQSLS